MRAFFADLAIALSIVVIFLAVLSVACALMYPDETFRFLWGAMHSAGDVPVQVVPCHG